MPIALPRATDNPVTARLRAVRHVLAIVLLALLPLQFGWAAVASYCKHETENAGHFGHHEHQHHGDAADNAERSVDGDAAGDGSTGAVDADCGHCHGVGSVMPLLQRALPELPVPAPPGTYANEAGGAQAPDRPERPKWLPLA